MKVLFHLGHPAHFHLFKNVISKLHSTGHATIIAIKKKDVLENLLISSGFDFVNVLPEGRKDDKFSIALGQLKQDYQVLKICMAQRPDLLVGTSVAISHVGKLLGIPSVNLNEDDAEIVPLYARLAYPWATRIVAPNVCSVGKWTSKKDGYEGYHELAYLHPDNFSPSEQIASKYIDCHSPVTIVRFAKLGAHHDVGVSGLSDALAIELIEKLKAKGQIVITSERPLSPELEPYRKAIDPKDMHHVMAYANLFVGDSQTMAAEAGVLGIPFIRFNDFVGRISYLNELELKYHLGIGIRPTNPEKLIEAVEKMQLDDKERDLYQTRRQRMLGDKLDLSAHLFNYITTGQYLIKS